jgi:GNAT superfamily N-acetyltransferase
MQWPEPWTIQAARREDWRALRMLLPGMVHYGSGALALVAVDGGGLVIGAAAVLPRLRSTPVVGPRLAMHVIEPVRRKGLALRLIEQAAVQIWRAGARAIYASEPVPADSEAQRLWGKLGFDRGVEVVEGTNDIARALEYLQPIYEQCAQRGWIAQNARIAALNEADAAQVASLHVKYLGGSAEDVIRAIRGETLRPYEPELSPVLTVGGKVVAFTLAERISPETAFVHATVVDPSLRDGWANVWLKFWGATNAAKMGITTLLHHSYEQHRDTRRIIRRIGTSFRVLVEPYRVLTGEGRSGD